MTKYMTHIVHRSRKVGEPRIPALCGYEFDGGNSNWGTPLDLEHRTDQYMCKECVARAPLVQLGSTDLDGSTDPGSEEITYEPVEVLGVLEVYEAQLPSTEYRKKV